MDIEDIEEGDKILVDTEKIPQVDPRWKTIPELVVEVTRVKTRERIDIEVDIEGNGASHLFDDETIRKHDGKAKGYINLNSIETFLSCGNCDSEKIYADSIEEYLCPFCEEDKLE